MAAINLAAALRGTLPYATISARDLGRLAKNPGCQRLATLTLINSSPGAALEHVFKQPPKEEQSEFAIRKGNTFERAQTENGAARLLTALQAAGILTANDVSVRDLRTETGAIKNPAMALKRRSKLTDEILLQRAAGDSRAPAVVLQAALIIRIGPSESIVVSPDALIASAGQQMYDPGEIKSYAYLRHLTDPKDVAQAASQDGVYGMALERRLEHLGIGSPISGTGVIIMAKPGGMMSIAKKQDITRDIATAKRIIDIRPQTLNEVVRVIGHGKALDNSVSIMKLQPCYSGACRSICPLHDVCRAEAENEGNPAILGNDVEAFLATANCSLKRGLQLLNGATPATPDEALLQQRLLFSEAHWRAA